VVVQVTEIQVASSAGYDWDAPWIKSPISLKSRLRSIRDGIVSIIVTIIINPPIPTHDSGALQKWYMSKEPRYFMLQCAWSQIDTGIRGYLYTIPNKNMAEGFARAVIAQHPEVFEKLADM